MLSPPFRTGAFWHQASTCKTPLDSSITSFHQQHFCIIRIFLRTARYQLTHALAFQETCCDTQIPEPRAWICLEVQKVTLSSDQSRRWLLPRPTSFQKDGRVATLHAVPSARHRIRILFSREPAVPVCRLAMLMNQKLPFDCRSGPRIKHPF